MSHVGMESWASSVLSSSVTSRLTSAKYSSKSRSVATAGELQPFAKPSSKDVERDKLPATREEAIRSKVYVIVFVVILFLGAALFSCVAPFFPTRAMQKGVSQTLVGVIMASMQIVGFVASWILAYTVFRIGIKFLMCSGMFVAGICAILFGIIDFCPPGDSFMILSFCIRIVEGIGIAMYFNSAYTMCAMLFADNYALVIGLLETATSIGTLLGPSIGGALYAAGGYFLPFAVLGSCLIVLDPLAVLMVPSNIADGVDTTADEYNPHHVISKMFTPAMLITSYTMLVTTVSWIFTETTLGVRLEAFGITDPLIVGAIYLSSSGAYAISAPLSGRIADKTSYAWLIIMIGTFLLVIGYLIIGPTPLFLEQIIPAGLPQLIIGCLCTHSGLAAVVVPTTKELQRQAELNGLDPNSIGTLSFITSVFQSIWFLGGFIGAIISSSMMEFLGFGWATTVQAGIVLTSLLLQFYTFFSHGIARECWRKCKGRSYESIE